MEYSEGTVLLLPYRLDNIPPHTSTGDPDVTSWMGIPFSTVNKLVYILARGLCGRNIIAEDVVNSSDYFDGNERMDIVFNKDPINFESIASKKIECLDSTLVSSSFAMGTDLVEFTVTESEIELNKGMPLLAIESPRGFAHGQLEPIGEGKMPCSLILRFLFGRRS